MLKTVTNKKQKTIVTATRDGKRLGYGGGFYDTLLAGPAAGVPLAGVCFPCQLLDDLPMEAHDRHVDMVIAPEGE